MDISLPKETILYERCCSDVDEHRVAEHGMCISVVTPAAVVLAVTVVMRDLVHIE